MKSVLRFGKFISLILVAFLVLPGCSGGPRISAPDAKEATPFRPPTLAAPAAPSEATPTILSAAQPRATNPSDCQDTLTYLSDLTIPDGMQVAPLSTLDKRWEVQNSGTCNWGEGYKLKLIAGDAMGAKPEQTLYPARSGSRAVIRLIFTAPKDPGKIRSAWQAINPAGQAFGDPIFIEISVTTAPPTSLPAEATLQP